MMKICNATVVTGDGQSILNDVSIVVNEGIIQDITSANTIKSDSTIDAKGSIVIPGIINHNRLNIDMRYGYSKLGCDS